jgi:hypothetical protein
VSIFLIDGAREFLAGCFSSTVPESFWLAGCQPKPMFRSQRPERCVEKLQIGTQKQILLQLDPMDFRVHDMEEV